MNGEAHALPAAELDVEGVTCVGDGALRYRTTLEERGAHVPLTPVPNTSHTRDCTYCSPPTTARPSWWSRSTCVRPTRRCRRERHHAPDPSARRRRPRRRGRDREVVDARAVVACDVRRRDHKADVGVPRGMGRVRARSSGRLRDRVAVRGRLARDEPRRRGEPQAARHRDGTARRGLRQDSRCGPAWVHAEVRASNDAALQLYEAMGFRRQGVRRGATRTTARTP